MTDTFTYDPLNRIATSETDGITGTYTYNRRGDRTAFGPTPYVAEDEASYTYDDRDRLTGVTTQGETVTYRYNGDNLLYERTAQGETTRYYYDGDQVIAEATVVDGVPQLKTRYIRGQGLVANEDAAGDKAYYLQNGHGDVIELRDRTGNTRLNQYAYDIWGNPTVVQENVHNVFRYSGEMWDTATKLQYLRARWYDPRDGRFLNEDTFEGQIDNPLSLNLYTYVYNNPLTNIDPTGHWCTSADGKWAHAGACSDSSSTYSDDMGHDHDQMKFNGYEPSGAIYHYPIQERYLRWKLGNEKAFALASENEQHQMWNMAKSDWTLSDATTWIAYGAFLGLSVIEPFLLAGDGVIEQSIESDTRVIGSFKGVKGEYSGYIDIANELQLKYYSIPINIWDKMSRGERWAANQKFLDRAASKGANFVVSTPLDKIQPGSYLSQEVDHLLSLGYQLSYTSEGVQILYLPK